MANDCKLTTIDNPFDPFEQFDQWFMFDVEKGYNCCSRLARIAQLTDDMSQVEIDEEVERAIDEIVKHDFLNIYKKVIRTDESSQPADSETNKELAGATATT